MPGLRIEWDRAKKRESVRKHKVSFEEAMTAFYDERALLLADPDHPDEEDRFILLGLRATLRHLDAGHCYRTEDAVI